MVRKFVVPALAGLMVVAAPAVAANRVEVTRFHTPETLAAAAPGPIAVRAAPGLPADTLQTQVWLDAVAGALSRQGFTVVADAPRVAEVSLDQAEVAGSRARSGSGVSVGVGVGSGGGWYGRGGLGGGVGVGLDLGALFGGGSGKALDTRLGVTIRDAAGKPLWEGRAEAAPRARSKDAEARRLAGDLATKLFAGFPGESGATIGAR